MGEFVDFLRTTSPILQLRLPIQKNLSNQAVHFKSYQRNLFMPIEAHIPLVEEILDRWQDNLGNDYLGYKNHVYRMIHFCFALHPCDAQARQKIIIAACFHDLGIWTDHTVDYLPPSIALVTKYLQQQHLESWIAEIELMIDMHHKFRKYRDDRYPLVEVFRKGDLVDFSLGMVKCGLPKTYIQQVKHQFPNAGFHRRLMQLAGSWFYNHPLSSPPFMKW